MTEIMPFPENNILFYWAAPHGGVFLCNAESKMQKRGVRDADNLRGCPRGQCVTDAGWSSYILWAPRPQPL